MRKYWIVLFLLISVMTFLWPISPIPVFDVDLIGKIVEETGVFTDFFTKYLEQFQKYFDKFKELKAKLETHMEAMDIESFENIATDPDDLLLFLNSSYLKDIKGIETWREIFFNIKKLYEKYKDLRNFKVILENPLYRSNPHWKEIMDWYMREEKDTLKDYENALRLCGDIRKWESSQMKKLEENQRQIKFFATNGTGTVIMGRLAAAENVLALEAMRIDLQMNLLLRTMMELDIKQNIKEKTLQRKKDLLENISDEKAKGD